MIINLKFFFLPLFAGALFLGINLNAEDIDGDGNDDESSYSLNLEGQAADFIWTVAECEYNPDHPYCKASAEIPAYPVYGMGYGWNWPYGSYFLGGYKHRRFGNPDRNRNR